MNRFGISSLVAVVLGLSAFIVLSFVQLPAHGQGKAISSGQGQPLPTRHVREAVSSGQAAWVGRLPATQSLQLNIALPLRNESELDQLLQQLYDPQSPSYHQFLSVKEFTERFGPSQEDYDAVISFAQSNGLTVSGHRSKSNDRGCHGAGGPYRGSVPREHGRVSAPDGKSHVLRSGPGANGGPAGCVMAYHGPRQLLDPASGQPQESSGSEREPGRGHGLGPDQLGLLSAATCGRPTTVEQPLPAPASRSGCWHLEFGSAQVASHTIST